MNAIAANAPLTMAPPTFSSADVTVVVSREPHWRVLALMVIYRILVAITLIALYSFVDGTYVGDHRPMLFVAASMGLLLFGISSAVMIVARRPRLGIQVFWHLVIDIIAILLILHSSGGARASLGMLLVVPIGGSSLIAPNRLSMLMAAIAAVGVVAEQFWAHIIGISAIADSTTAGVVALVILTTTIAIQPIARRFREAEHLAAQRSVDLANLSQLNDYIIQHLRESIIVLDEQNNIRLANASAIRQLGIEGNHRGQPLAMISPELHSSLEKWRLDQAYRAPQLNNIIGSGEITPHFAPIGQQKPCPVTIFLEDSSQLAERVQQVKLAALGRLSASIAHEIRNPVTAISHASQLLNESEDTSQSEKKLATIIHKNTDRVNVIIRNVLQLSRRDQVQIQDLSLSNWLVEFRNDYLTATQHKDHELVVASEEVLVRMDASHLHQVLWNLCDNAFRYGTTDDSKKAVVEISAGHLQSNQRPFLTVSDRGAGIDEEFHDQIFEPFFSDSPSGVGLGLFIARQLCECNQASLGYEPRAGGGACFRIVFADPNRWTTMSRDS
ncbi:MAG: ATPase [Gammaproteobacteria bacterium]|nr:ATPase [Gammaproteobacteria bacterium]